MTVTADRPSTPETREWPQWPDLAGLQASDPRRYPGLFLSSGGTGWDVLFAFPQEVVRIASADGLRELQAHPAMQLQPGPRQADHSLPFSGGWLCAFAYELGGLFEPSVRQAEDDADFPLAWLVRIPAAILFDRANRISTGSISDLPRSTARTGVAS